MLNLKKINHFLGLLPILDLLPLGLPAPEGLCQKPRFHMRQPPGHNVVQHAHPLEQRDILKRPRHPPAAPPARA